MNKTCKAATISPWNLIISMLAITVQFSLYNTFSAWVEINTDDGDGKSYIAIKMTNLIPQ